jgi:hypothetical protein
MADELMVSRAALVALVGIAGFSPGAAQAKEPPPPPPPTVTLTTITAGASASTSGACVGVHGAGFACGTPPLVVYPGHDPLGNLLPSVVGPAYTVPDVVQIAGIGVECGLFADPYLGGAVACANGFGQPLPDRLVGGSVHPVIVGVVQVTAGTDHACAVKNDNTAWCWGSNTTGQLGIGTASNTGTLQVAALGQNVAQIAAGQQFTCAVTLDGAVSCWGRNDWGQVGNGTTANALAPVTLDVLGHDNVQVAAGTYHACALKAGGTLWCWGSDAYGVIGGPTDGDSGGVFFSDVPVQAVAMGSAVADQIALGQNHTCFRSPDKSVWCWGSNSHFQLGPGATGNSAVPVLVTEIDPAETLSASGNSGCARNANGDLFCWGSGLQHASKMAASVTVETVVPTVPVGGWRVSAGVALALFGVVCLVLRRRLA